MLTRSIAAAALALSGLFGSAVAANAQDVREAEIIGFHQLCDHGDKRACVRFGMLIQQGRDRHELWRRTHSEWFWWDR